MKALRYTQIRRFTQINHALLNDKYLVLKLKWLPSHCSDYQITCSADGINLILIATRHAIIWRQTWTSITPRAKKPENLNFMNSENWFIIRWRAVRNRRIRHVGAWKDRCSNGICPYHGNLWDQGGIPKNVISTVRHINVNHHQIQYVGIEWNMPTTDLDTDVL